MILSVGRHAVDLFVHLQGDGNLDQEVTTQDGVTLHRSDSQTKSTVRSIFGTHRFQQFTYASGPKKAIALRPISARMSLPAGRWSKRTPRKWRLSKPPRKTLAIGGWLRWRASTRSIPTFALLRKSPRPCFATRLIRTLRSPVAPNRRTRSRRPTCPRWLTMAMAMAMAMEVICESAESMWRWLG